MQEKERRKINVSYFNANFRRQISIVQFLIHQISVPQTVIMRQKIILKCKIGILFPESSMSYRTPKMR